MGVTLYNNDVLKWAFDDEGESEIYHALFTDPPYHMGARGFMEEKWDAGEISFDPGMWGALIRRLRPGAFGAVFTSAANYHRVATAIDLTELVEIYPMIAWVNGHGMGLGRSFDGLPGYKYGMQALKPAIEPLVVFRKKSPLNGVDTLKEYGTGSLHVLGAAYKTGRVWKPNQKTQYIEEDGKRIEVKMPSNVILSESAAASVIGSEFFMQTDECSVIFDSVEQKIGRAAAIHVAGKVSRSERDAGLEEFPDTNVGVLNGRRHGSFAGKIPTGKNFHPTVKPIGFNKWLAKLLLPPPVYGPYSILNPFSGSGSEAIGSIMAGWDSVTMIEQDERYCKIAEARIRHYTEAEVRYASRLPN